MIHFAANFLKQQIQSQILEVKKSIISGEVAPEVARK